MYGFDKYFNGIFVVSWHILWTVIKFFTILCVTVYSCVKCVIYNLCKSFKIKCVWEIRVN